MSSSSEKVGEQKIRECFLSPGKDTPARPLPDQLHAQLPPSPCAHLWPALGSPLQPLTPASPLVSPWGTPGHSSGLCPALSVPALVTQERGSSSHPLLAPAPCSGLSAGAESSTHHPTAPQGRGCSLPTGQPTHPRQTEQQDLLLSSFCTHGCCPLGRWTAGLAAHLLQTLAGTTLGCTEVARPPRVLWQTPTHDGCSMAWLSVVLSLSSPRDPRPHPRVSSLAQSLLHSQSLTGADTSCCWWQWFLLQRRSALPCPHSPAVVMLSQGDSSVPPQVRGSCPVPPVLWEAERSRRPARIQTTLGDAPLWKGSICLSLLCVIAAEASRQGLCLPSPSAVLPRVSCGSRGSRKAQRSL